MKDEALAGLLPWIRGRIGGDRRLVCTVDSTQAAVAFSLSDTATGYAKDASGTHTPVLIGEALAGSDAAEYCPKAKVQLESAGLAGLAGPADGAIVILPGIGVCAWASTKAGADALALAAAKRVGPARTTAPPIHGELAGQVVVVIGAGSGIGREVAKHVAREGAHVVAADLGAAAADSAAADAQVEASCDELTSCGLACDITSRESVRKLFRDVVLRYGGFDSVVVTAGVVVAPDRDGHIPDDKWALTFAVNVTGSFIVAEEAAAHWRNQGLTGSLVLTTSANAVVAKKGSFAYDTSKAAANHLVRELAIELAPLIRVNGVAPATVVKGSSLFPRNRVIANLVKYGMPFDESESDDSLRDKLAGYYAKRTLLKEPITPEDQAQAYIILLSGRLPKTTGQIIAVDGGLDQAFLR